MLQAEQLTAFHKELDLIQDCIKRMASNSFLIKGWTITYIGGILALFNGKLSVLLLAVIILLGVTAFWYLDAFFLQTERAYREMYKEVVLLRSKGNFDNQYNLDPNPYKKRVGSRIDTALAKTLWPLYGIPFVIAFVTCVFQIGTKISFVVCCCPCNC